MQRRSRGNRSVALILLGTLPIIYFGLKIAPFVSGGFQNIIQHFPESLKRPILDKKYVLEKHPNYSAIVDGGGKAYEIELLEDKEIVRTEQVIKVIEMTLDDVLAQAGFIFKESGTETEEEISEKRAKAQADFRDKLSKEIILVSSDEINNRLKAEELKQYNERLGK